MNKIGKKIAVTKISILSMQSCLPSVSVRMYYAYFWMQYMPEKELHRGMDAKWHILTCLFMHYRNMLKHDAQNIASQFRDNKRCLLTSCNKQSPDTVSKSDKVVQRRKKSEKENVEISWGASQT